MKKLQTFLLSSALLLGLSFMPHLTGAVSDSTVAKPATDVVIDDAGAPVDKTMDKKADPTVQKAVDDKAMGKVVALAKTTEDDEEAPPSA